MITCRKIEHAILSARKLMLDNNGYTAWNINNGLCDVFADEIIKKLGGDNEQFHIMSMLDLVCSDRFNNWSVFDPQAIEQFNIKPTHNLSNEDFFNSLKKYADATHVWITLHNDNGIWHFDAECPEGVNNPMLLPTFDKFVAASACGIKESEELISFLGRWKERSESSQKPAIDGYAL